MGIVGKNSDENKILMSIINKCITQISSQEVSQITISHTVANGYQLTWTDVLYKFLLSAYCHLYFAGGEYSVYDFLAGGETKKLFKDCGEE